MVNSCFLKYEQVTRNITNIIHIPTTIVHGRYDMLCAPQKAYELHQALPHSELFFTQKAGHASRDEGSVEKLIETMDKLAKALGT
jgi:proline iminopeptidase